MGQTAVRFFTIPVRKTTFPFHLVTKPIPKILTGSLNQPQPFLLLTYFQNIVNLAAGTALYLSSQRAAFLSGRFVYANWNMEQLEGIQEIVREDLLKSGIKYDEGLDSAAIPPGGKEEL